jgi:1-acyl-sn-glycerol-3-phosphate acyltransferase
MISINRSDKKEIIHLLKESKRCLREKRVIAIFPEGTRGRGRKLLPFKPGANLIAKKYSLKVQPVVIIGSKERFDTKTLSLNPGIVKIIFLPPCCIETLDELKEIRSKMQNILDENFK